MSESTADTVRSGPNRTRTSRGTRTARLHHLLHERLGTLNERLARDGARVVAFATFNERGLPREVLVLLWRVPRTVAARPEDASTRRLMAAADEALSELPRTIVAHQLLEPSQAYRRPGGHRWVEVAAASHGQVAAGAP